MQDKLAKARERRLEAMAETPKPANLTHAARQMRDPDAAPAPVRAAPRARTFVLLAGLGLLAPLFAAAWIARPLESTVTAPASNPAPAVDLGSEATDPPASEATSAIEMADLSQPSAARGAAPMPVAATDRADPRPATEAPPRPDIADASSLRPAEDGGQPSAIPPGAFRDGLYRNDASPVVRSPAQAGLQTPGNLVSVAAMARLAAPPPRPAVAASNADAVRSGGPAVPVVFHVPSNTSGDTVSALRDAAGAAGFDLGKVHRQGVTIRQSNVRYFHEADRPLAAQLARAADADLRDFTGYRPSPPVGTIEFWAAGRAPQTRRAPTGQPGFLAGFRRDLDAMGRGLAGALRSIGD